MFVCLSLCMQVCAGEWNKRAWESLELELETVVWVAWRECWEPNSRPLWDQNMPLKCWAISPALLSGFCIVEICLSRPLRKPPFLAPPSLLWAVRSLSWLSLLPLPLYPTFHLPTQPSRTSAPTTFLQHVRLWLCDMLFSLLGTNGTNFHPSVEAHGHSRWLFFVAPIDPSVYHRMQSVHYLWITDINWRLLSFGV